LLRDAARSRMLRRLASSLRHDLNSPLQAALWAFDLIDKGLASPPDSPQRARVATSVDLGRRELVRLQQAVRLFLGSAAPLDDDRDNFNLNDILPEIRTLVGADASLHGVELQLQAPEEPIPVFAVRAQVQQALVLLTLRALDATGHGGNVQVICEPDGADKALVRVIHALGATDDGRSANEDERARLVWQVSQTIATAHGGALTESIEAAQGHVLFVIRRRPAPTKT